MAERKGTEVVTTQKYQSDRYDVELKCAPPAVPKLRVMRRNGTGVSGTVILDHHLNAAAVRELIDLLVLVRGDLTDGPLS